MSRASASRRALTRLTGRALNMRQPRGVMDPRCSDSADALQIGPTLERLLNSSAYETVDAVSGQARPRKKPPPSASAGTGTWIHVVKRDETLSGIFDVSGWQRVAQLNNLRNPNLIYPGQQLRY